MKLSIVSDTTGAKVGELTAELRAYLETRVENYFNSLATIGIAIRCLTESSERKTFMRFIKKDMYLTIDICFSLEEYSKYSKSRAAFSYG